MKLAIHHEIRIALPAGIGRAVLHLLLTPSSGPTQTVREWKVELPETANPVSFIDGFGNRATLVAQAKPLEEWVLTATGTVDTIDRNGVLGRIPGDPVPRLFLRQTELTTPIPELVNLFTKEPQGQDRIGVLHRLMNRTPGVLKARALARGKAQSQSQTQGTGQSSSQSQVQTLTPPSTTARPSPPELAHAFIGAARAIGIPTRYVTGYLAKDTATAPAMHAWAEAYDDAIGWIGFDPLMQLCPTDRHIRIAIGLDATSAAPLRSIPAAIAVPTPKLDIQAAA